MNESVTEVFVEQPLALHGSDKLSSAGHSPGDLWRSVNGILGCYFSKRSGSNPQLIYHRQRKTPEKIHPFGRRIPFFQTLGSNGYSKMSIRHDLWLEAKKRVKYIWVSEIMIYDLVHKDTQSWICFQFLANHSRVYAVSSQSWTFETDYTQKLNFHAVSWHKEPPDNQTIQF